MAPALARQAVQLGGLTLPGSGMICRWLRLQVHNECQPNLQQTVAQECLQEYVVTQYVV
jgi:hypothetical protein